MSTFEAGKTYKTRDGRDARVYATDGGGAKSIHGAWKTDAGHWYTAEWYADGSQGVCHEMDLMPPKRELWVNVFSMTNGKTASEGFASRERADYYARSLRIARIRVEYTEGQFDE